MVVSTIFGTAEGLEAAVVSRIAGFVEPDQISGTVTVGVFPVKFTDPHDVTEPVLPFASTALTPGRGYGFWLEEVKLNILEDKWRELSLHVYVTGDTPLLVRETVIEAGKEVGGVY